MDRDCGNCFYCEGKFNYSYWKCGKRGGRVEVDSPACSDWMSDETKDCCDCDYCESATLGFKCTRTNKRIFDTHQPACRYFMD